MPMLVSNRYARALADVVAGSGDYHTTMVELEEFAAAWRESLELREIIDSPAVTMPQKDKLIETIGQRLGVSPSTLNFFRVLLANYRMALVEEVVQAYRKIANDRMGVVHVTISSAAALSASQQEALAARFRELTHKQVELEYQIDSELLGGILGQIGSTVYDGSVRGNLTRIRAQLMAR